MSAAAMIPSLVPQIVVVAMRRADAVIHRRLASAGAFADESAIQLSPSRSLARRRRVLFVMSVVVALIGVVVAVSLGLR